MYNSLPYKKHSLSSISFNKRLERYSQQEKYKNSLPYLIIEGENSITKKGSLLTIKGVSYDVSSLDIKNVVEILINNEMSVQYIENEDFLNISAIHLCDILSEGIENNTITKNPLPIDSLHPEEVEGMTSLNSNKEVVLVFSKYYQKKLDYTISNNMLLIKDDIQSSEVYFKTKASKFIWHINLNSIVTNSKNTLSRFLK